MPDVIADCREFARQYPTPNVRRALRLADAGRIAWTDLYKVFRQALAEGLAAVAS